MMILAMRLLRLPIALWLVLAIFAAAREPAVSAPPDAVVRQEINVPGADEPHTPAALNRVAAFRYFVPGALPAAKVLVLIPGLNSGVNTLDLLARSLTASPGPILEVWVVKQRPTLLQDRRGIEEALALRNPDIALGYYYGKFPIDGRTFRPLGDVPGAAFWGLDVHLRDIRAIVQEVHRRFPQAKVVLGGHSLGGILAALYAGYDFGRIPGPAPIAVVAGGPALAPEAGARALDGLLLVDGIPLGRIPYVSPDRYLGGFRIPFVGRIPGVNDLLSRRIGPFTDIANFARTQDSILFDIIALYAYLRPDSASYLPFHPRKGLPITNEALLAGVLSSQMQPDLFIRASIGVPWGIFRRVPDPAELNRAGLLDLQSGRPAPGEASIRWIPSDQPTPRPRVDLRALEEAILRPGADFTQWYMPWRLFLDLGLAAQLDTSDPFARQYMSLTQVRYISLPLLIIGAGEGLIRDAGATLFYRERIATPASDVSTEILRGFTHLDLEDAVENPAVPRIRTWLETMIH